VSPVLARPVRAGMPAAPALVSLVRAGARAELPAGLLVPLALQVLVSLAREVLTGLLVLLAPALAGLVLLLPAWTGERSPVAPRFPRPARRHRFLWREADQRRRPSRSAAARGRGRRSPAAGG